MFAPENVLFPFFKGILLDNAKSEILAFGKLTVPELTVNPFPITIFPATFVFPLTSKTYPESTLDLFIAIFENVLLLLLPPPIAVQ